MITNNIFHLIRARFMLFALISTLFITKTEAQREYKHDVSMGYGLFTSNQIFDAGSDLLESLSFPEGNTTSSGEYYGGYTINYRHSVSKHLNAGLSFSFDKVLKDVYSQNQQVGDLNRSYYTIAGEMDWRYFKKEIFQMYSLVGIGYTFIRDRYMPYSEEEVHKGASGFMNFHLSIVGVRLGKDLAFFSELGFGYKGILSFGFSYQF